MAVKELLLLGNMKLYMKSRPVEKHELSRMEEVVENLCDTLDDFRSRYDMGRAMAAAQVGVMKRLIYMQHPQVEVFINPVLHGKSSEMVEVWDHCMSFPELRVRVMRHKSCVISYRDLKWNKKEMELHGELAHLMQHECDHLDGILAVGRAVDNHAFSLRGQKKGPLEASGEGP